MTDEIVAVLKPFYKGDPGVPSKVLERFGDLASITSTSGVAVGEIAFVAGTSAAFERAADAASDEHYDYSGSGGVKWYENGPSFSTRARMLAAHARNVAAGRSVPDGTIWNWLDFSVVKMPAGHAAYGTDPIADLAGWIWVGPVTPLHFGAVGDGATDDTTVMQSWATELRTNGGDGYLPPGYDFKVSSLYLHPEANYSIRGGGKDVSYITIDNSDRTAVGLKFTHTDGSARNAGEYEISGFTLVSETGNKACLIEHINASAPKLHNIKIVAYTGTTALRYAQVYNGDFDDIDVWGAGFNAPFKDVGAATFSITAAGTTLTASASVFAAGDVGRKITLINGGQNETFTISSYTSGTEVEVNTATVTATSVPGTFGGVRGSMTAASATLTLEADVLTADDVGRVVYVLGAGPTVTGSDIPLRSTITAVSGTTITLDDTASNSVTNAELIIDPAVDFGNTLNSYSDYTNDSSVNNLMVPQFRGTGLVASGVGWSFRALKLHGVNSGVNETASNIQAMFSYFQGYVSGRLEQTVAGNLGRIIIAGGRRGWAPTFSELELSVAHGLPCFYGQDCNSAVVGIGDIKAIGDTDVDLDSAIESGDGSVTFTRTGTIALYGASKHYTPVGAFGTFTPTLTSSGDMSWTYTRQEGWYQRVGKICHFSIMVEATLNAYTTASGGMFAATLPFAASSDFGDQPIAVTKYQGIDAYGTATAPHLNGTLSAGGQSVRINQAGDSQTAFGLDNDNFIASGSIILHLTGSYVVA